MAIGPEARRTTSGRVVVVAAWYAVLGALSIVLGLGPFVRPADAGTRAIAIAGMLAGAVMLSGVAGLLSGRSWGRAAGVAAAWAAGAVGSTIVVLAMSALGTCGDSEDPAGCAIVTGGPLFVGAVIVVVAFVAARVVRHSRLGIRRGQPRRS